MSDITPISRLAAPTPTSGDSINRPAPTGSTPTPRGSDKVELSNVSKYLAQLQDLQPRTDLVNSVKSQIAAGTYETNEKLESAISELANDLN